MYFYETLGWKVLWAEKCLGLQGLVSFKWASSVQISTKSFSQNSEKFGYSFITNDIYIFKLNFWKLIILGLFKILTLNLTMHILTISACP